MISILVVDDEDIIRKGAVSVIEKCVPDAVIIQTGNPRSALDMASENHFDVAFLDIEMPKMTGIELAKKIKKISPDTNIIFCTAYPEYVGEAMHLHASGYITKPVTAEKVKAEMTDLRRPLDAPSSAPSTGLRIQAFGNFEVFNNDAPLKFKYSKTKELLAYLVDRNGAIVDSAEIQAILWEDDDRSSYYKQLRKDLMDTLKEAGAEDAVETMRGGMGVVPARVKCDYFDYLAGLPQGINAYHGEYMTQYSWAEATHGSLEMKKLYE